MRPGMDNRLGESGFSPTRPGGIMSLSSRCLAGALQLLAAALFTAPTWALDLNGAWAADVSLCGKVFSKKGSRVTLTSLSDLYGGGFIIDGNRVRGEIVSCNIESKKEDGSTIHLSVACTTEIATEQVQFDLKVVNDNTVSKTFPGTSAAIDYHRCTL
jgi:hypothetical protein